MRKSRDNARFHIITCIVVGLVLACVCLPLFEKKAEAACNTPEGEIYDLKIENPLPVSPATVCIYGTCGTNFSAKGVPTITGVDRSYFYVFTALEASKIIGPTGTMAYGETCNAGIYWSQGGEYKTAKLAISDEYTEGNFCGEEYTWLVTVVDVGGISVHQDSAYMYENEWRLPPGKSAEATLTGQNPANRGVKWVFTTLKETNTTSAIIAHIKVGNTKKTLNSANAEQAKVEIPDPGGANNKKAAVITADPQTGAGTVLITVQDFDLGECCSVTSAVPVGCAACAKSCPLSTCKTRNGSVHVEFSLGRLSYGGEAGGHQGQPLK